MGRDRLRRTHFFDNKGILQSILNGIGLGFWHPDLLSHERSALIAVMITFVWSMFGTNMIIFLAGMSTIDQEIYDAARVDGAGNSRHVQDHPPTAQAVRAAGRDHQPDHGVQRALQPDLRDDERRPRVRHDDARVLHLPEAFTRRTSGSPRRPGSCCSSACS